MIANFFGKSKPISILVILILCLFFYLLALFSGKIVFEPYTFLFLLPTLGLVYFIIVKNELTFDNSYAFLLFVILMAFFSQTFTFNKSLYTNLILLIFLRRVYSLQSSKKVLQKMFDAGIWLGILFEAEPFTLLFFIILYTSIYLHQQLTIRTLLIPIIGFCTPLFLYFTYCFWFDKVSDFHELFIWNMNNDFSLYKKQEYVFSILFTLTSVFFFISVKTPKVFSVKNTFRLNWALIILNFILSIFLIVLTADKNGSEFLYALLPCAIIIANGLEIYQKKWIADVILILFLAYAVSVNFL